MQSIQVQVPFLDLKAQYRQIKPEVDRAILDVIENTAFVLGPAVARFEADFAGFCGSRHCIAVNSGTTALFLALAALGVKPGDEVVTAANTFIATCEAISYTGATPVLVDVDPRTYTIDPKLVERKLTSRTRAIIPVHLYGQCADLGPILELGRSRGIPVIEDAAQAHGARYGQRRAGSLGHMGCFSFYPSKNLGAYGEGGAILTDDEELAASLRRLRDHGSDKKYVHDAVGYNARLEGIQGAVLATKLKYLDEWNEGRRTVAQRYGTALAGLPITLPTEAAYGRHVYHLYVILTERRDELLAFLNSRHVGCLIHYPIPVHLQKAYAALGHRPGAFPVTEELSRRVLSLPMFPELTAEQIEFVADCIRTFHEPS